MDYKNLPRLWSVNGNRKLFGWYFFTWFLKSRKILVIHQRFCDLLVKTPTFEGKISYRWVRDFSMACTTLQSPFWFFVLANLHLLLLVQGALFVLFTNCFVWPIVKTLVNGACSLSSIFTKLTRQLVTRIHVAKQRTDENCRVNSRSSSLDPLTGTEVFILGALEGTTVETRWNT